MVATFSFVQLHDSWNVLDNPVEDSTRLTTTKGNVLEARGEGGELIDSYTRPSAYSVVFELYAKRGAEKPIEDEDGVVYDGDGAVVFQSKDVTVNCVLRAESMERMWRGYDALLHDLVRPGERKLFCKTLGREFPFHYKSSSVSEFAISGKVWLKFSLTICVFE